jgi:hypothetical protein
MSNKKIFINAPVARGAWDYILSGYKSAWEHFGFQVQMIDDLANIEEKKNDYYIFTFNWNTKTYDHIKKIKDSINTFVFVQSDNFPPPWGGHPNFTDQAPPHVSEHLNNDENIFLWTFTNAPENMYKKYSKKIEYIPLAFDSINYKEMPDDKYRYDVCYVGGWANNGFNEKQKIMMDHFKAFRKSGLRCGFFINKNISLEEEAKVLFNSKISINIHDAYQRKLGYDTNERTFKALGLGGFLVSDHIDELSSLLPEVYLSKTPDHMVNIIKDNIKKPHIY